MASKSKFLGTQNMYTSMNAHRLMVECIVSVRGSRNFCQGGGGGGGGGGRKRPENSLDNVFFCFLLVLNLFYSLQRGSKGFITEKTILFKGSRGSNFSRGGGGSKC